MEQTIHQQSTAFLLSLVLGLVIAVIYTFAAMVRIVSPPSKLQLFISDILFMIMAGFMNLIFAVSQTEGSLRYYTAAAELISFFLFYLTIGKFLCRMSGFIFSAVCSFVQFIFKPIRNLAGKTTVYLKRKCNFISKNISVPKNISKKEKI